VYSKLCAVFCGCIAGGEFSGASSNCELSAGDMFDAPSELGVSLGAFSEVELWYSEKYGVLGAPSGGDTIPGAKLGVILETPSGLDVVPGTESKAGVCFEPVLLEEEAPSGGNVDPGADILGSNERFRFSPRPSGRAARGGSIQKLSK
jgi:hypothetical protein